MQARPRGWLGRALRGPEALVAALLLVASVSGFLTTPGEYGGVRDDALFRRLTVLVSNEVFPLVRSLAIGSVAVAMGSALLAAFVFRGLGLRSWRARGLTLAAGWALFLLGASLRAPALFDGSLLALPLLPRVVFLLAHAPALAGPLQYLGLYGVPVAVWLACVAATVRLRWWPLLPVWPALVWLIVSPHVAMRERQAAVRAVAPGAARSVLVVGIDSLRADHLERMFDGRAVAPHLAALVSRALTFTQTVVAVPRTAPSLVSLFRSSYPSKTGVSTMFPAPAAWAQADRSLPTYLRLSGYRTFAVGDYAAECLSKIDLGFEHVAVPTVELPQIVGGAVLLHQPILLALASHPVLRARLPAAIEAVLAGYPQYADPYYLRAALVEQIARADAQHVPFFGFAFASAPHFPYASLFPYWARFTDWRYGGAYRFQKNYGDTATSAEDQTQIRALYAGALAMSDDWVGSIIALLAARGVAMVITSDHGELLYDVPDIAMGHGDVLRTAHSYTVPMLFFDPTGRWPRRREDDFVRSIDFAPTLLDLLRRFDHLAPYRPDAQGVFVIPGYWDGVSLVDRDLRARRAHPFEFDALAYSETELWMTTDATGSAPRIPYPPVTELLEPAAGHGNRLVLKPELTPLVEYAKHRMLLSGHHKFLYQPTTEQPVFALYDLAADPDERRNLIDTEPALAASFKTALERFRLGYRDGMLDD